MYLKDKVRVIYGEVHSKFKSHFGFEMKDTSLNNIVEFMFSPKDSSSLAATRILFGLCMLIDIIEERGGSTMDERWGDPKTCHFPLFPFIRAMPIQYMALVYAGLWIGALGIMLGYKFNANSRMFVLCYWYLFVIDKSFWNNHSYLYGLVASLLSFTRANCYWSIDAHLDKTIKSESVPYWNYFVLKYQFFILYFVAGLKKGTAEWLTGYSLLELGGHWVFAPFRLILTVQQIDYLVVHWFAFLFDLTVAFWMMWARSRHVAMLFCAAFHLINTRLFSIGMFPWVCLATMPLFYPFHWPKLLKIQVDKTIEKARKHFLTNNHVRKTNDNTSNKEIKDEGLNKTKENSNESLQNEHQEDSCHSETNDDKDKKLEPSECQNTNTEQRRKRTVYLIIMYMLVQAFLPYSHFITKGYNNWTNGLYGYSWDMMVHTWQVNTIVINIKEHDNHNKSNYLDPMAWALNDRWTTHGDMLLQYAQCIKENLANEGIRNISIYADIWYSMNERFQQRMFDPKVDLLTVDWSPFRKLEFLVPLLTEAADWRSKLHEIRTEVQNWGPGSDAIFIADFPGNHLEIFLPAQLTNITLTVLEGTVAYEPDVRMPMKGQTVLLAANEHIRLDSNVFHKVLNIGSKPTYYMFSFTMSYETEKSEESQGQKPMPLSAEFSYNSLKFFRFIFTNLYQLFFGCQCR